MNTFDFQRFIRVFANDLILLKARRIAVLTLALMGMGLLVYLTNIRNTAPDAYPISWFLFPVLLTCGGAIFTSMIYADMHHPLERFHYMTLPCSNLERFVSRYLITAPLYYLYAIVVYYVFELIAKVLCAWLLDATFAPFNAFDDQQIQAAKTFFIVHALFYTGAIYFRSLTLIKTVASLFAVQMLLGLVFFVSVRIFYWDQFTGLMTAKEDAYVGLGFAIQPPLTWVHELALTAGTLWVLFLGYLGLRDYEVQDGL